MICGRWGVPQTVRTVAVVPGYISGVAGVVTYISSLKQKQVLFPMGMETDMWNKT